VALPRWAAVLVILGLIVLTFALFGLIVGNAVADLIANSDFYTARFESLLQTVVAFAQNFGYTQAQLDALLIPNVSLGSYAVSFLDDLATKRIPDVAFVLLIVVYMLLGIEHEEEQKQKDLSRGIVRKTSKRAHRIDKNIRTYVLLHSLISLIAAVITTFVLLVFEVDLAFFFGVATFILGFIPNLGPAIATVLPLPMIILDPRPVVVRLIFTTIFLSSTQFTLTQFVEPRVLGMVMNIPAVTIVVSLLFWGSVWGILGAIISVPLTVSIKMYLENVDHPAPQAFAKFLGGDFSVLDLTRNEDQYSIEDEPVIDLQASKP